MREVITVRISKTRTRQRSGASSCVVVIFRLAKHFLLRITLEVAPF